MVQATVYGTVKTSKLALMTCLGPLSKNMFFYNLDNQVHTLTLDAYIHIAQLVERMAINHDVEGSSPSMTSNFAFITRVNPIL